MASIETSRVRKPAANVFLFTPIEDWSDSPDVPHGTSHMPVAAQQSASNASFPRIAAERSRVDESNAQQHAQKLQTLGAVTCGIAHDLNNMLAIIGGFTSLIGRELPQGHAVLEWLDPIADAADRGLQLVRQITALGRPNDEREVGQLQTVVESSLRLLRSTVPGKIAMRTDFTASVPNVRVNMGQMSQIVMNLCINASHAIGSAAGTIGLAVNVTHLDDASASAVGLDAGSFVTLSISDNGCGMSEATAGRIFEPYFTTKAPDVGTGLGLAVVRDIVAAHNGTIRVHSRVDVGTTFTIYLPCS